MKAEEDLLFRREGRRDGRVEGIDNGRRNPEVAHGGVGEFAIEGGLGGQCGGDSH